MKDNPRQKLRRFVDEGRLRQALERANADRELIDYAISVIDRYCAPRKRKAASDEN